MPTFMIPALGFTSGALRLFYIQAEMMDQPLGELWLPNATLHGSYCHRVAKKSLFGEVTDFQSGLGPNPDGLCKGLRMGLRGSHALCLSLSGAAHATLVLHPREDTVRTGMFSFFCMLVGGAGEPAWHPGSAEGATCE